MDRVKYFLNQVYRELQFRNYSPRTVRLYMGCLKHFLNVADFDVSSPSPSNIKEFLVKKKEQGKASQTICLYLNSIKFFYRHVIYKPEILALTHPKRTKKLPIVLMKSEIKGIINNIRNQKHKLMVALAYSSGLRVSEVVKLKVKDVNLEKGLIHIRLSKGKKDRYTIFSDKLVLFLKKFMVLKKAEDYLFESERGGRLTSRTLQVVFKKAVLRAGINKNITFHTLRHSFASHLLETGVNLRYLQKLLGHKNLSTTQIYTSVALPNIMRIKSPL